MPRAAAASAAAAYTVAEDLSDSGGVVLATPALIARICTGLDSATDSANVRLACKATARTLDWFDIMWRARQDIPKVHEAIKQHASVIVSVSRIKRTITGSLGDVWSCPPLLKWVVLQAAKQGDAELLRTVLGRKQQPQQGKQQQRQQPDQPQLQQAEQQRQKKEQQPTENSVLSKDMVRNQLQLCNALKRHVRVFDALWFPLDLARERPGDDHPDAWVWLAAVAAEEAVSSNNRQLLVQMVQEEWFSEPLAEPSSADWSVGFSANFSRSSVTSVKQQLGPAFLAAAAASDVESGKVLLSYCPDLLDYALWNAPGDIQTSIIGTSYLEYRGLHLEVLPFASQLYMGGFQGIKLTDRPRAVLAHLCDNYQRQPESVQMLLDLGVARCDEKMVYTPSLCASTRAGKGYCKVNCPIIVAAVAEQNAGAVAVLLAAGASLPAPEAELPRVPFNYNDLQAVLEELERQAAAGGWGGETANQCRAAAEVLRAYCEQHGREKIEGNVLTFGCRPVVKPWYHGYG